MRIDANTPEQAQKITQLFRQALDEAGIRYTGGPTSLGSPTITPIVNEDGSLTFSVQFNEYGIYLDKGVAGAKEDKTNGSPFGYGKRGKGIFKAMSSSPFGNEGIAGLYWFGIAPKPWVTRFRNLVLQDFTAQVSMDIQTQVLNSVRQIQSTALKITI
jgi:hypothetical protein